MSQSHYDVNLLLPYKLYIFAMPRNSLLVPLLVKIYIVKIKISINIPRSSLFELWHGLELNYHISCDFKMRFYIFMIDTMSTLGSPMWWLAGQRAKKTKQNHNGPLHNFRIHHDNPTFYWGARSVATLICIFFFWHYIR